MTSPRPTPSPRLLWVTLGYVVIAIGFCFVPGTGLEWFPAPRSQVLTGGVVAAVTLGGVHLLRRRWPIVAVVAGLAVMVVEALASGTTSVGAVLIECDCLYSLVISRSRTRARDPLTVIAAVCTGAGVGGLLLGDVLTPAVVQFTIVLLAFGVTLWWGITVRDPMTRADEERERATLIAESAAARQRETLVAERLQISRELHDTISGHLSAISIQSAGALVAAGGLTAEELTERLERIRGLSLEAMASMRTLIEVLRTDPAQPVVLPQNWSSVDSLLAQARSAGASIILTGDDPGTIPLDPLASVTAYNALREALVNADKHAPGEDVTVDLRCEDNSLIMRVCNPQPSDPGDEAVSSGYGLIGLTERVRLCGGDLHIDRSHDTWTLRVRLPLTSGRESHHAGSHHRG